MKIVNVNLYPKVPYEIETGDSIVTLYPEANGFRVMNIRYNNDLTEYIEKAKILGRADGPELVEGQAMVYSQYSSKNRQEIGTVISIQELARENFVAVDIGKKYILVSAAETYILFPHKRNFKVRQYRLDGSYKEADIRITVSHFRIGEMVKAGYTDGREVLLHYPAPIHIIVL